MTDRIPDPFDPPGAGDPAGAGWTSLGEDGFIGLVGPLWRRGEGAALAFGFIAAPKHVNLIGVVQGGMLMTFADRALGIMAWNAAGGAVATITFDMAFVEAGRIGSFIEAEGEVVRRSSSLVFMRGTLRSGTRIIATCQGTWKVLSRRRGAAQPGEAA